jgi:hypothetical protein
MRRCHDCNSRYVKFGGSLVRMNDLRGLYERLVLVLLMTVAVILISVAVVWFSHARGASASESGRVVCPPSLESRGSCLRAA